MVAERAGYTVTMFLIDTSPSMGTVRTVDLPPGPNGEAQTAEMTNLEWALQFVKLKIQEMIFNGRKTDQCGVIVFGSENTDNIINEKNGGYENVSEYIPVGQPNARTLAKIDALEPSSVCGDPIDALIVGIETQAEYLASKKTWTRKIIIVTDGESPIEVEDWEATVHKMDALDISLTVVGVDFDDEELPYTEPNKTVIKTANEEFYHTFIDAMKNGVVGTCAFALQETMRPDVKQTKSTLMGTVLRLGDVDTKSDEAIEIIIKTSKCTALARPKSWKKFAIRKEAGEDESSMKVDEDEDASVAYAQLKMRSEYYIDTTPEGEVDKDMDVKMEEEDESLLEEEEEGTEKPKEKPKKEHMEKVEKEQLVRGFKYGTTYAPCPDGQFPRLPTKKGIDICGFFLAKNFRRELSMGEIQYVWADPGSAQQQVALSSIVQALYEKDAMAIARWVTKDGMDPKMGVLKPVVFDEVDCLLWAQMPFADDIRKYTFASLDHLVNKKGELITEHPYIPTQEQLDAMDNFVDCMDLMDAGEKDEEGHRQPWFDTLLSYNPAIHRTKQALFHSAIVSDITTNPLPPPHPELLKYFNPPKRVLKRSREALEECKSAFKVKPVPKKVARIRQDGHVHALDEDDTLLLLDRKQPSPTARLQSRMDITVTEAEAEVSPTRAKAKAKAKPKPDESETESESEVEDEELLLSKKSISPPPKKPGAPLPTPERSLSPSADDMDIDIDRGRAPGRIIGTTYPLVDFRKNLERGDVVSKAVEDLGAVVTEIVMRPFASRRKGELMECLEALRDTCLKEDEIEAWNAFLEELKDKCTSEPGNSEFWSQVKEVGRSLSLISDKEAKKYGGTSDVSEKKANEFIS
ncbi:ATP-dependent DNA helicase II subunit 2 [Hypsizygus marmoreus]|uniref:ATP-dependent DNA helicase II subunit 2 n=1 Tax=Hypsizygus marmoreus TaxID=39966 RepID=A0A369KBB1_HYPMA|nr:ATP-dependent DNA helicase II subunit 2 [Hypsizygus marmoreus]